MRSEISFEDASLEASARLAARVSALREGRLRSRQLPTKPRAEPFRLGGSGWPPLAWLWRNLIAAGPFFRLRTWLIACAVAVAGISWLARRPPLAGVVQSVGIMAVVLGCMAFLYGPLIMMRRSHRFLRDIDLLKAHPLPGWQAVLGELLTPMVIMTFIEWFLWLVAVLCLGDSRLDLWETALFSGIGIAGVSLVTPLLCGLMMCVPYGTALFFPAWAQSTATTGGGVEVMGQRLIMTAGYLLLLVLVLLPPAGLGAVFFIIVNWLAGPAAALIALLVVAAAILVGELAVGLGWLGSKFEQFDLSTELPR